VHSYDGTRVACALLISEYYVLGHSQPIGLVLGLALGGTILVFALLVIACWFVEQRAKAAASAKATEATPLANDGGSKQAGTTPGFPAVRL